MNNGVQKNVKKKAQIFICDFCAFTTQRKSKMDTHLLTLKHKNFGLSDEKYEEKSPKYYCEKCNYTTLCKNNWNKHLLTLKHESSVNYQEKYEEKSPKYYCEKCNYTTLCKNNWNKHLLTLKHKSITNYQEKYEEKSPNCEKFGCKYCNHMYSTHKGLMLHQNKCAVHISDLVLAEQNATLMEKNQLLADKNEELTNKIIEICTKMGPPIITNNSNNNSNNTFNLNFFLNETCKNAMSLKDFVSSIQLQLTDLEETGRLGFSGGISNIITNSLNKMETEDRPMHCTDSKRETIYIKGETEWQKDENKEQLTAAIRQISNKNSQNIMAWRELNPDCTKASSKKNNQYLKIVGNAMAGGDQAEIKRNIDKVVSNVAKQIVINK